MDRSYSVTTNSGYAKSYVIIKGVHCYYTYIYKEKYLITEQKMHTYYEAYKRSYRLADKVIFKVV